MIMENMRVVSVPHPEAERRKEPYLNALRLMEEDFKRRCEPYLKAMAEIDAQYVLNTYLIPE